MNKLKTLSIAAALTASLFSVSNVNAQDLSCGHNGKQNCEFVYAANTLKGNNVIDNIDWNTQDLGRSISRKEFITYISRAYGYSGDGECTGNIFNDVNVSTVGQETCARIEHAAELGLTASGPSRPNFEINKALPRKEYASFLIRFAGYDSSDTADLSNATMYFPDISKSGHVNNINMTKKLGIFNGVPKNGRFYFEPERNTSLGESFATLARTFD